jgi:hypothetical protein
MRTGCRLFLFSLAVLFTTSASARSPVTNAEAPRGPDAVQTGTLLEGVNDQGWIAGRWTDAAGNSHWFLMNPFLPAFSDALPRTSKSHVLTVNMNRF